MKISDTVRAHRPRLASAAALLSLASSAFAQDAATPAAPAAAPLQLEAYSVTGSRVARLDSEGPQPVVTYSSSDIAASGYTNISDFLQAQSFNSGGVGNMLQTSTSGVGVAFSRGASSLTGNRISGFSLPAAGGKPAISMSTSGEGRMEGRALPVRGEGLL